MARYAQEPPYAHGTPARIGVVLVNLGSPESPTPVAVRAYLKQFLSDPRVVELPRVLWWPILYGWVLITRPRASAQRYAQVWMSEGAPLRVHTERQTALLRGLLAERASSLSLVVDYAMRYGRPSLPETLQALKSHHCDRVLLVPLYPQYSASATGSVFDAAYRWLERQRNQPAIRTVREFHDHGGYIASLAQNVRDHWARHGRPDRLVMSFHGLPRASLDRGDPYHCQCRKTARLLGEALGLTEDQYSVTFQSRFGAAEWLKPYTAEILANLGRHRVRRVDVVCPGFVSDCLETLEEIGIEGKAIFLRAGGREFHAIACLNERPDWLHALADIVMSSLPGWTGTPGPDALERSRERALGLGASI